MTARGRYLAKLYYGLGMQLAAFDAEQCADFAADDEALLVGAEEGDDGTGRLCLENAQNFLRSAVDLDPSNAQAEHMLASVLAGSGEDGASAGVSKASPAFVKALFDDFSDSFDEKLVRAISACLHRSLPSAHLLSHTPSSPSRRPPWATRCLQWLAGRRRG